MLREYHEYRPDYDQLGTESRSSLNRCIAADSITFIPFSPARVEGFPLRSTLETLPISYREKRFIGVLRTVSRNSRIPVIRLR